jgi:hypothetical protein
MLDIGMNGVNCIPLKGQREMIFWLNQLHHVLKVRIQKNVHVGPF